MLFLGGGHYSFIRTREAIAMLLICVMPPYPTQPNDCEGVPPPCRHLYVLAARPRLLVACDADSGLPVTIPASLHLKTTPTQQQHSSTMGQVNPRCVCHYMQCIYVVLHV